MLTKQCSDTFLPVPKIMNGVISLIDRAFITFEDFIISEHCQCCIESVNALTKIMCLVRMLIFLIQDLNNIKETFDQIDILINNYEVCRKTFYRIEKLIHKIKSQ
jgi:hypothetical protein